ncbi:MAG: hypothetical protein Q7R65_03755, partial [bacterium]|nr:hypothetical protein [bacterium]
TAPNCVSPNYVSFAHNLIPPHQLLEKLVWGYTFTMVRNHILPLVLYTAMLMAALHIFAVIFSLYWLYWWIDIPLHFLGGFCVGLFSLWFFCAGKDIKPSLSSLRTLCVALAGAFVVGLGWEIFEYYTGAVFNVLGDYTLDTLKDLTMDVTGGYVAHFYFLMVGFNKVR